MPRVSVIIPTHNRSKQIELAIASVLAQSYADLEAIVVDDGSEDDTVRIVEACAQKDPRIRLIEHHQRRGAQAARNSGIFAAKGEWIAFLDSDDEWLHDSLALRLRVAANGNLQVEAGAQSRRYGLPPLEGPVYGNLLQKPGTFFPGLLVASKCFKQIGRLDESIVSYQEWDVSIRLAKYYRFGFVSEPTFVYNCRHGDNISKDLLRNAEGYEQVFTKHFWPILHQCGPKVLVEHYQTAAHLYAQANDANNERRCSRNAFFLWPLRPRAILHRVERLFRPGI
jgi:glycosyltransferase involved in cell wall biosynthesis